MQNDVQGSASDAEKVACEGVVGLKEFWCLPGVDDSSEVLLVTKDAKELQLMVGVV